ncbi:MAG: DUF1904 family protein [Alphaproteobacteria bacterium]
MPNLHVIGLSDEEGALFSRRVSDFFETALGTPRASVYVFLRDVRLYRDGRASELPVIVEIGWVRRPREHFLAAVEAITRIVREDLGRSGSVQVELREKWEDAAIDGELCSDWAARRRG